MIFFAKVIRGLALVPPAHPPGHSERVSRTQLWPLEPLERPHVKPSGNLVSRG